MQLSVWDIRNADCSGLKRAVRALACQEKHFIYLFIYFLQFNMNSSLLFFPAVGFVYVVPLTQRPRPSPPAWSSDIPWSECHGDLGFPLPDLGWKEARGAVRVQIGVRVVDPCLMGSHIQKIFFTRRQEGNSSCQWVVLAHPALLGCILLSEANWRIFQIPKILSAQQNKREV